MYHCTIIDYTRHQYETLHKILYHSLSDLITSIFKKKIVMYDTEVEIEL